MLLIIGGLGYSTYYFYSTSEEKINTLTMSYEAEVQALQTQVANFQNTTIVYRTTFDINRGIDLEEPMWESVEMPTVFVTSDYITNPEDLIGAHFIIPVTAKSIITRNVLSYEPLAVTDRYVDVVLHQYPVGMQEGSVMDIRFINPVGQDWIVLPHKRVLRVGDGTIQLILDEVELNTYESAVVDSFFSPGSTLYGLLYVEPAYQDPAQAFYPISSFIADIMRINPNIKNVAYNELVEQRRKLFENNALFDDSLQSVLEAGRQSIIAAITSDMQTERDEREGAEEGATSEEEIEYDEFGDPILSDSTAAAVEGGLQ